jgi:hypothetical protein
MQIPFRQRTCPAARRAESTALMQMRRRAANRTPFRSSRQSCRCVREERNTEKPRMNTVEERTREIGENREDICKKKYFIHENICQEKLKARPEHSTYKKRQWHQHRPQKHAPTPNARIVPDRGGQFLREGRIVGQRHLRGGAEDLAIAALHKVLLELARVPHVRILLVRLERNQLELCG